MPGSDAEWRAFCATLGAGVKEAATLLTALPDRSAFKALNPVERRAYPAVNAALRSEFLVLPAWPDRNAVTVMVANPAHLTQYESLGGAALRTEYRKITPDERDDLTKTPATEVAQILADPLKMQEWRTWRNCKAIEGNPTVAAALGINAADPIKFAEEIGKLSIDKAGERIRRLVNEVGFENAGDRESSLVAVRDSVKNEGKAPFKAMEDLKPSWVLKGKLTKNDGGWKRIPILKAIAHTAMVQYGELDAGFKEKLLTANGKNDPAGKADFEANRPVLVPAYLRKWKNAGNSFDPEAHLKSYEVQGRAGAGAYWMYDAGAAAVLDPALSGQDIIKMCAIEESPEYNDGFTIVELPSNDALQNSVRRPTVWDGLQFDQFKAVEDPAQSFGVTSGGTGEVVVAPVAFSACIIKRNVGM